MPENNNWRNLENVLRDKVSNLQNEVRELREKTLLKQSEIAALGDALAQVDRFKPKKPEDIGATS